MTDFTVSEARVDAGQGGMACGPVRGPVVGEAKFTADDGTSFYLSMAEVEGMPQFFKTPESTLEDQINMVEDNDFWKKMEDEYFLDSIRDYSDVFANTDDELHQVYRYMIYLVRCSWDEAKEFISSTEGKRLSGIEIPKTDLEEEWEEEE